MIRTVALVLFGVATGIVSTVGGAAAAAPVPKHLDKRESDNDKGKLQGKWKVESLRMGDQDILALVGPDKFEMTIEFQGDQVIAAGTVQGTVQRTTSAVKYDPAKKQLHMTDTADAAGKPAAGPKESAMGYAFDGDKLIVASSPGGNGAADPLKPGKNDIVMVLSRVKEK